MPKDRLTIMAEGIIFSLLNYCLEVFSNVGGLNTNDETSRHSTAFRKQDNLKLQVLVNKVLRALTDLDRDTPTSILSSRSGQLSVHQRTALFTVMSVHKVLKNKEPVYSHSRLKPIQEQDQPARPQPNCKRVKCKLSISRGGFFYRGSLSGKPAIQPTSCQSSKNFKCTSFQEKCKTMDKREHSTSSSLKNALAWLNLHNV